MPAHFHPTRKPGFVCRGRSNQNFHVVDSLELLVTEGKKSLDGFLCSLLAMINGRVQQRLGTGSKDTR